MTIIDEALTNAVEFHEITEQSLHSVMGQIPPAVRERNKEAWETLDALLSLVKTIAARDKSAWGVWDAPGNDVTFFDRLPALFDDLLSDLTMAKRHEHLPSWNDEEQRKAELQEVEQTLRSVIRSCFATGRYSSRGETTPEL